MSFADLTSGKFGMSAIVFATLGEPVTLTQDGESCTLTGLFKSDAEAVDMSSGVPLSTVQPVLELRVSDLPQEVLEDDRVTVQGVPYRVVDVRPDGHGTVKLFLHKAPVTPGMDDAPDSSDSTDTQDNPDPPDGTA